MKNLLRNKLYYSISEVAELTNLQPYTLRAWEKEFSCLRPRRVRGKNRAYRQRDICIVLMIKRLLHEERYTIQGVRQKIKSEPELLRHVVENYSIERQIDKPGGIRDPSPPSTPAGINGPSPIEKEEKATEPAVQIKGQNQKEVREVIRMARNELYDILELL